MPSDAEQTAATLYAVGYQGRQPDEFVKTLKRHGINTIIDVREIPYV